MKKVSNKWTFNSKYAYIQFIGSKNEDKYGIIDLEDYDKVKDYKWNINKDKNTFYIQSSFCQSNGEKSGILLHRFLFPEYKICDHKNRNGLDNRKENIREATISQNNINQIKQKGIYTSKYKGVSWNKRRKKWESKIVINGKKFDLGFYNIEEKAAIAYNIAARYFHPKFAVFNNVDESQFFYLGEKIMKKLDLLF